MNSFQTHQWWVNPLACTIEDGTVIKLDYKQMQLLCYLANKPEEVISRNELLDNIWPNQHIADDVLNVAISGIRKALGDDSKSPKFIKTVPRVGYQFIAPVSFTKSDLKSGYLSNTETMRVEIKPPKLIVVSISILLFVLFLIWFATGTINDSNHVNLDDRKFGNLELSESKISENKSSEGKLTEKSESKLIAKNSIKPKLAILPMTLLFQQTDHEQLQTSKQYQADGITAAIIDDLAGNPQLSVLSRQTMFHSDRLETTEAQFVASLDADYYMRSSMTFQQDKLEISAQLLLSASQKVLWQNDYSLSELELYKTQKLIVSEINRTLKPSVATPTTPNAAQVTQAKQSPLQFTDKAYDHYLQGQYHLRNNQLKDAETQFLASVNEASRFAPGYAGLAQLYFLKAWGGADKTMDYLQVANRYTQEAWQLDPADSLVLLNKALSAYFLEYELEKAQSYFERAQQKNPSDVMVLEWFQSFLINTGQFEQAKLTNQKMRDVSPLLFNKTAYYDILYLSGDFNGALSEIESVNPYMNSELWASAASSWVYLAKGEPKQFASHFVPVLQRFNVVPSQIESFQQTLSAQGIEAAIALVLEFTEGSLDDYSKAELLAYIGASDKALSIIEKKVKNREIQMFRLEQEPLFRSLHDEPKFQELLNNLYKPVR